LEKAVARIPKCQSNQMHATSSVSAPKYKEIGLDKWKLELIHPFGEASLLCRIAIPPSAQYISVSDRYTRTNGLDYRIGNAIHPLG